MGFAYFVNAVVYVTGTVSVGVLAGRLPRRLLLAAGPGLIAFGPAGDRRCRRLGVVSRRVPGDGPGRGHPRRGRQRPVHGPLCRSRGNAQPPPPVLRPRRPDRAAGGGTERGLGGAVAGRRDRLRGRRCAHRRAPGHPPAAAHASRGRSGWRPSPCRGGAEQREAGAGCRSRWSCSPSRSAATSRWSSACPAGSSGTWTRRPLEVATLALSLFWASLALGRLVSSFIVDRMGAVAFATTWSAACGVAILAAINVPSLPLAVLCFAIAGFAAGPVYPMIMAIGGSLYPGRASMVSSVLASAAVVGSIVYPPLMGVVSEAAGMWLSMLGAALFAFAAAGCIWAAARLGRARDAGQAVTAPSGCAPRAARRARARRPGCPRRHGPRRGSRPGTPARPPSARRR